MKHVVGQYNKFMITSRKASQNQSQLTSKLGVLCCFVEMDPKIRGKFYVLLLTPCLAVPSRPLRRFLHTNDRCTTVNKSSLVLKRSCRTPSSARLFLYSPQDRLDATPPQCMLNHVRVSCHRMVLDRSVQRLRNCGGSL